MPELPEVETIRRQLAPFVEGRSVAAAEIIDPRWTRPRSPGEVADALRGARIQRINRFGKYLAWELDGDRHLLIHLRMTGALLYDASPEPTHTRARFELDDGHRLAYVDPRRFGTAELLGSTDELEGYLGARLGMEPLEPGFNGDYLRDQARGRITPVKAFLLDQRRLAGVGNIYADEALFRASVHPLRPAGKLSRADYAALAAGVEDALRAGIAAKGASIDDFRHVDGARGSFQDQFLVHRREGRPCPRCGTAIRKLVVGGRGTYVCESCQRRPRTRRPSNPLTTNARRRPRGTDDGR